jgi:hypothetical protein
MSLAPELAVLLAIAILGGAGVRRLRSGDPLVAKGAQVDSRHHGHPGARGGRGPLGAALPDTAAGIAGVAFHIWWCRMHGIDPVHATPRKRYYELRGWGRGGSEIAAAAPRPRND